MSITQTPSVWVRMGVCLVLIALVLAVYWPATGFGYVEYDDSFYVTRNSSVHAGLNAQTVAWAFTTFDVFNWHPLTWLSLMLDTTLLGDTPAVHHSVNIALHALNVLLLLAVLTWMTGMFWRSALVAALLAMHPVHVESVAWVSERKDVLSLLFWLLTMAAYVRYVRKRDWRDYVLTLLMFSLGLMAKSMVVTLPCVLLLMDFWPLKRIAFGLNRQPARAVDVGAPIQNQKSEIQNRRRLIILLLEKLPFIPLAAIACFLTVHAQRLNGSLEGVVAPLSQRLENAVVSYMRYLGSLFWPADLAILYPNPACIGRPTWSLWQWSSAAAGLLVITILALLAIRRRPYLTVGWLWYLGTLVPVIGLVQIGRQAMADRYTYIPFIGLYIALAWLIGDLMIRMSRVLRTLLIAGLLLALLALAVAARRQVWIWRDSPTLFEHALAVTEDNWTMQVCQAQERQKLGDTQGAMRHFEEALRICPDCLWERTQYAIMLGHAGEWYRAEQEYRRVMEAAPNFLPVYTGLGHVLIARGQAAAGLEYLRRAVDIDPSMAETRILLVNALSQQGLYDEAAQQLEEAIRLRPAMQPQLQPMLDSLRSKSAR